MTWKLAYNTNGFAHHRLPDALDVLGELGYEGVALTLDNQHLDPFGPHLRKDVEECALKLAEHRLDLVIESGARFNLDFRKKHYPSLLVKKQRGRRLDFLVRCLELGTELGASCVSLWSGHNFDELPEAEAMDLLVDGLERLVTLAEELQIDLAFEPEPGMFIETVDQYAALKERLPSPRFGLALDLGHLLVTQEAEPVEAIRRFRGEILTIAVEDMKRGIHDHLPFGEGDMDFPPIFEAIAEIGYRGLVSVELSRASSDAVRIARESEQFLRRFRPA